MFYYFLSNKKRHKFVATRMATILATRWTGNKLFKGWPNAINDYLRSTGMSSF